MQWAVEVGEEANIECEHSVMAICYLKEAMMIVTGGSGFDFNLRVWSCNNDYDLERLIYTQHADKISSLKEH